MDAVGTQHGRRRLRQLHRLHNKRKGHSSHGREEKLNDEGRLIVAGAMPKEPGNPQAGFYGSTIIVDFDSREALEEWLQEEPFLKEGVYAHIDVKPFNKAFPQG